MKIKLDYNEKPIPVKDAFKGIAKCSSKAATDEQSKWWKLTKPGDSFSKVHPKGSWFNSIKIHPNKTTNTLAAQGGAGGLYHYSECRKLSDEEIIRIQSYPDDYNFLQAKSQYLCGMSVPPFMLQRIAIDISKQLLGVENMNELKTGPWNLTDLDNVQKIGKTVFSCFSCGGGSTMGYKLAGYDVIGCCEIDPQMLKIYKANHNPKYSYLMGVQDFKNIPNEELPTELFDLDVLDGSPPCSSFSMAGSREKKWSVKKKFREGQAEQVLDDLFFHYIDIAKKLQPKVVVAENVKGLIQGNARGYVKQIFKAFKEAGYSCQLFLLNAAAMGVPQRRERTFFIAHRLDYPKLKLEFNEKIIPVRDAWSDLKKQSAPKLTSFTTALWKKASPGENMAKYNNGNGFNNIKCQYNNPSNTVPSAGGLYHPTEPRQLSEVEVKRLQSFPDDFTSNKTPVRYLCGMSVPPFMMQRIADQIYKQWLRI